MNTRYLSASLVLGILLTSAKAIGEKSPKDITIPNEYAFVSATYFTSGGTTNATITVRFQPGSRAWSGAVNYTTHDGTAVANQDYVPASGTLTFSGVNYRTFTVPVTDNAGSGKTIQLFLTPTSNETNAVISRSNAVLSVNLPPPPELHIAASPGGIATVSWTDDGTSPVLEKRLVSETAWSQVTALYTDGTDTLFYSEPMGESSLFRLRRLQ